LGISTLLAIRCLTPNLKTPSSTSPIFFAHVAQNETFVDYQTTARNILQDANAAEEVLLDQIWPNSQVAYRKFRRVGLAMHALGGACIFIFVTLSLALVG
jgi:hypothetical protein